MSREDFNKFVIDLDPIQLLQLRAAIEARELQIRAERRKERVDNGWMPDDIPDELDEETFDAYRNIVDES